jgi:competence protein ComGC
MKREIRRHVAAFTRIELGVVISAIAVVGVLVAMLLPGMARPKEHINWIKCIPNLKEIGMAYRFWAEDNGKRNPAEQAAANGGWGDFLTNADEGAICWTNYAILQNELGQDPRVVICPQDERAASTNFSSNFDNTHVSYFVGVSANDEFPKSIQGGDRNLGSGRLPDSDYGYSPKSGKGNDVAVPVSGPVSWSLKMHSAGYTAGAGNILLGDGSVQQVSSAIFRTIWLPNAEPTTNWPAGHLPSSPSIRLVFP